MMAPPALHPSGSPVRTSNTHKLRTTHPCMLACPAPRSKTMAFKAWVWLLLFAVLLQGGAGAVVQVLGQSHSHQPVHAASASEPAAAWLGAFLAWRAARMQALQASAVFKHAGLAAAEHHHDGLERHHHGPGDATVLAVDRANTDGAADGTAHAAQPVPAWAWITETLVAPAAPGDSAWPAATAPTWTSALARLPERPPRA